MTQEQTIPNPSAPAPVPPALANTPKLGFPNTTQGTLTVAANGDMQAHHLNFAEFEEGYLSRYIALADTKATLVFGLMSGLLAYILGRKDIVALLMEAKWEGTTWILAAVVTLLGISAFCSVRVIVPRLFTSTAKGLIFFGSVANYSKADEYTDTISRADEPTLTRARLGHCYDLARVCNRKYLWLRAGLWIGLAAIAGVVMMLILVPPK